MPAPHQVMTTPTTSNDIVSPIRDAILSANDADMADASPRELIGVFTKLATYADLTKKPVTLEVLCDSPFLCGKHYREVPIGPKGAQPHYLCIAADSEADAATMIV